MDILTAFFVTLILVIWLIFPLFETGRRGKKRKYKTEIGRRSFRRPAYVYLLRSVDNPSFYKVGFTRRNVALRASEISTRNRMNVEIIYSVKMPYAEVVEGRIHNRLSACSWRVPFAAGLGNEWYTPARGAVQLVTIINQFANEVEQEARAKKSWGENQSIFTSKKRITA